MPFARIKRILIRIKNAFSDSFQDEKCAMRRTIYVRIIDRSPPWRKTEENFAENSPASVYCRK